MLRRTFKYRLYPNREQKKKLCSALDVCRHLYNDALQERRDAWKTCRKNVTFRMQSDQLPGCKQVDGSLGSVYAQVLQDVLHRLDFAFKTFFAHANGYPRFRSASRYDSLTYPQSGFAVADSRLQLSKIGNIRIKLHRPVRGQIKTLTIKTKAGHWYAFLSCIIPPDPLSTSERGIGIDMGVKYFAVTSEGEIITNPHWVNQWSKKIRRAARRMWRRKMLSQRRKKAAQCLARVHLHTYNQRADFQHKLSRRLINDYGIIAVEDLDVARMLKSRFSKAIHDAGWSTFMHKLAYKAESAGREFIKVDPNGTSQRCTCGNRVPKKLSQRTHDCSRCGLSTDRDHASALEILRLGLSRQALTPAIAEVACETRNAGVVTSIS